MGYLNNNGLSTLITLIKNALGSKVDKVTGKQLSTNDFTNELKTKVESYEPLQQATTDTLGGIVLGDAFQVDSEGKTQVTNAEIGVRGVVALSNDINSTSVTSAATPALVQAIREAAEGIPKTEKGVANGVATLDGNAKVKATQLPVASVSTAGITQLVTDETSVAPTSAASAYMVSKVKEVADAAIPISQKGIAQGVATLDANGDILVSQLPDSVWQVRTFTSYQQLELYANPKITDLYIVLDDLNNFTTYYIYRNGNYRPCSSGDVLYDPLTSTFKFPVSGSSDVFYYYADDTQRGLVTIGDKDSDADALTVTSGKEIYDEFKGSATGVVKDSDKLGGQPPTYYGKAPLHLTATITAASWTGSAAPYTQEITIAGILATDAPHITPVYSDTLETALAQKEAWGMVSEADAGAGKLVFTCFEDKPTVAVPIQVEVMR